MGFVPPAPHTLLSHDAASGRSTYPSWNWKEEEEKKKEEEEVEEEEPQ